MSDALSSFIDVEDRVHRRADAAGVALDFPDLALFGGELEAIDVARFFQAAVESERQLGGGCRFEFVVRFRFQDVAVGERAKRNGRWRDALFIFDEQIGIGLRIGRHRDFLLDRAGRIAEKLHLQLLASFAAGRIGDVGRGKLPTCKR